MSRRDDLQQLIINYGRRLQKLQEQQALRGLDTPPHTLIEIEDIQAKIAELEEKLAALAEADFVVAAPYSVPEQQTQPYPQPPTQRAIFVGRQTQLAELERHWQEAYQQRGKVVFLVGEAGIGKTSLVREFSQGMLAKYPQIQYAEAQCDQIAGDISPYAPFVQLLNNLTEQATRRGKHWSVEFIREIGPDILGMVPVAGPILATAAKSADFAWRKRRREDTGFDRSSQFGQQDIFQQFTDTFRNLARHKSPMLLFIDDWHWADTSSTNLLFHLARQLSDVPILLLATYRPHDAQARKHPILSIRTEMERYQLCTGVSLDFLSRDDLIAYLNRRFPQTQFESAFVDWLLDITNGNALFASEYVNLLVNQKLLTSDGQLVSDLAQVLPPANVKAVIRSRLGFLDQEAQDILAYGSVEGEQFTLLVLSHLLDIKLLPLIRKLRANEETHHLIASLGQQNVYQQQTTVYKFVHTLIYQTLNNTLEIEERKEIQKLLLAWRSQVFEQAEEATQVQMAPELAALTGEIGDFLAQAKYALVAATASRKKFSHTETLKHCRLGLNGLKNLDSLNPEAQRIGINLLLCKGWTEEFVGEWTVSHQTYQQAENWARSQSDTTLLSSVLRAIGWTYRRLGNIENALSSYKEAAMLLEESDHKHGLGGAYQGIGKMYELMNNYDEALMWYQKVLAIRESEQETFQLPHSYHAIGKIYMLKEEYHEALAWFQRGFDANQKFGGEFGIAWNHANTGFVYYKQGQYEQSLACYQSAISIWQKLSYRKGVATIKHNLGLLNEAQGQTSQALKYYEEALMMREELGNPDDINETRQRIAEVEAKLGK